MGKDLRPPEASPRETTKRPRVAWFPVCCAVSAHGDKRLPQGYKHNLRWGRTRRTANIEVTADGVQGFSEERELIAQTSTAGQKGLQLRHERQGPAPQLHHPAAR